MLNQLLSKITQILIQIYQWILKPILPPSCRHMPSCSEYMKEAVKLHGFFIGGGMGLKRICKCHPWGTCGYDPVPLRIKKR